MSRTVFCTFLRRPALGQDYQLYPGEIGKRLFNEISQAAWEKWMERQTMFINERKLNMLDMQHRKSIEEEMIKFLFQDRKFEPPGYSPQQKA
ncbi:oxidative damage protection protein [Candidatus Erwinia haradaeae]|uniref:Probable Fe(2+)-trafficking protein n=1 Tax=Candidatus Erwinia haradaeae TaxID=1922217 RepID=A0A451D9C3_9GAMM|nr:oxidative damage protection protein [Candidatus Erwinia haradaeae]VFP82877.1 Probable Fe(2+)-trafficking protein [Candidatus Erwinia haradaeae]